MSSFYGGKQGRTYHIVQRYGSVQQMTEAFAKGGAYTEANYGQYVIIDTVLEKGRSNIENGLLYRRGFDYNDSASAYPRPVSEDYRDEYGFNKQLFQQAWKEWVQHPGNGAIYVGQIVGPEGRSPQIEIETWEDFNEEKTTGTYNQIIIDRPPGKEGSTFNDYIRAGYVNIRDQNDDIIGGKIAFDIPYTVMEAQVVDTNPYLASTVYQDQSSIEHPFYYKWNYKIPGGKHGQDIKEITIESGSDTGAQTDGFGNPIVNDDKYYSYSINNYDQGQSGNSDEEAACLTEHLGRWPYRVIDNINLIHPDRIINEWNSDYVPKVGDLQPVIVDNEIIPGVYFVCIVEGQINPDELLQPGPDGSSQPYQIGYIDVSNQSWWRVIKIPQTTPAHSLIIDYTAGDNDEFEKQLRNLDYLSVDKKGNLYAIYSDKEEPYYLTNIGGLDSVVLDDVEGIIFNYSNETSINYPLKQILSIDFNKGNPIKKDGQWQYDDEGNLLFDSDEQDSNLKIRYKDSYDVETIPSFKVKRLDKIIYNNNNLNDTQHIQAYYIGGEQVNVSQSPINLVTAIGRKGDNILVLYSDPDVRANIPDDKKVIISSWTDPTNNQQYQNLEWYNFGQLGAQYHVQGQYHYADLKGDISYSDYDANTYINLSEGFKGDLEDRMGWLVTVTDNEGNIHIYAYDYNGKLHTIGNTGEKFSSHWYEIMQLSASMIKPSRSVAVDSVDFNEHSPVNYLVDGGLWFVVSYGHDDV